ncbi:MAG: adenylosuccinate lyase [Candidatus Hodarchaeota archaeon]
MIHPIEERYRTELADIFEENNRISLMLNVEVALAKAHFETGLLSHDEYEKISSAVSEVTPEVVKGIEKQTHHDIMALVQALTDASGCDKVHIGATSNDIVDTTLALQLKKSNEILLKDLSNLKDVLLKQAKKTKKLICIGRTHGQHALPMTYGLKFALWSYEIDECLKELERTKFYGKMSGAIGTFASFGEEGELIQSKVLSELGLTAPLVTNQVVSRIFLAKFLFNLISVVCVIEKIGKEIRNLQRSEIGEVTEPFAMKQIGSSTMPHKRNPHKCENLCAIAKRVRTNILPALENISLEHERDLTNSANERIIIPETVILTHYMIKQATFIFGELEFFEENIKRNLQASPSIFMEKRMMELIREGYGRQEAYEKAKTSFKPDDPESYLGLSVTTVDKVIEALK